jgi:hypothetical protein
MTPDVIGLTSIIQVIHVHNMLVPLCQVTKTSIISGVTKQSVLKCAVYSYMPILHLLHEFGWAMSCVSKLKEKNPVYFAGSSV